MSTGSRTPAIPTLPAPIERPDEPMHAAPTFNLGHNDLQALINAAVTGAMRQREREERTPSTKGLKIADQKEFTGKSAELQDFLANCEVRFAVQPDVFDDHAKKIAYTIALMKGVNAEIWRKQYIRDNFRNGVNTDTWNLFKDKMEQSFKDIGRQQNAIKKLNAMRQGRQTIEEFNVQFLLTGSDAGYDFSDTLNITQQRTTLTIENPMMATLIGIYQVAINPNITEQIVISGEPRTIGAWMTKAAEIDSAY